MILFSGALHGPVLDQVVWSYIVGAMLSSPRVSGVQSESLRYLSM